MIHETVLNGKTAYCQYDEYQDALFVTFDKEPPLSYYDEKDDGILVRREVDSDRIIGYTIRNISAKVCQKYEAVLALI